MKKIFKQFLKRISPLIYLPEIIVLTIIGSLKYKRFNKCWLISERGDEAKDNGYHLFKYIQDNKINCHTYFLIRKDSNDYKKLNKYKNIIEYGGYKHKIAYLLSECLISTHYHSINPWKYIDLKDLKKIYRLIHKNKKYVFLQHGIIMNDVSDYLGKKNTDFDLFICGAKPEYEYIKERFSYNESEIAYTGLPRFDNLNNYKVKNQILLMPTWRGYLKLLDDSLFLQSDYYNQFQSLLNNTKLINLLNKYDHELIFYPHYEMQKYIKYFYSSSEKIRFAYKNKNDVQELLKESKLLITDYSSVFFDFAYMKKPTIYYQFDQKEFFTKHYKAGYFIYEKHGFGPVCLDEELCIEYIERYFKDKFKVEDIYTTRRNSFFELNDNLNCNRIVDGSYTHLTMQTNREVEN
ncbi:CDP-glycerol glycerophosphotransferase family protein [Paraclostridium sordellii]|uniref:CDP-glycerol glycerophosphotransferase family protein n=1 Tax=Paraclostridium sordellii TaxID=1505 RepID=UPI0013754A25|nr:CDP-glycerol glycerophosphotransferase family protein [Paeniclostridium sordellii]